MLYLFDLDGTLLTTITNPTPQDFDNFGIFVTALSANQILIAAWADNTGATNTGAAYLFSIAPADAPLLTIRLTTTNTVAVFWPSPSTGYMLQQNTNSFGSVNWSNVLTTPSDNGVIKFIVTNPLKENCFYRLIK